MAARDFTAAVLHCWETLVNVRFLVGFPMTIDGGVVMGNYQPKRNGQLNAVFAAGIRFQWAKWALFSPQF